MNKELLCTLGPASMNDRVIGRLTELGVALFRINLSHTALKPGEPLPDWFMRDVVQDVLRGRIEAGGDVFVP
ncbi:MAG: hypothetical protein IIA00_00310 [Proteobacteria bacterium]|nr:hypothetical protein [Pseudomonadota bacterium]